MSIMPQGIEKAACNFTLNTERKRYSIIDILITRIKHSWRKTYSQETYTKAPTTMLDSKCSSSSTCVKKIKYEGNNDKITTFQDFSNFLYQALENVISI